MGIRFSISERPENKKAATGKDAAFFKIVWPISISQTCQLIRPPEGCIDLLEVHQ